ncbi:natural killer cell receptor 2B4 isoform X1 [Anser cygnoides]|uniref:natural killer cell receptor 2B4 isoform X1 n=1 Tax=Anser cygnoides TaxID=8845 RepID=UPI0034D1F39F
MEQLRDVLPAPWMVLCLVLWVAAQLPAGGQGCEDRAVPAGGELRLLPKEPPPAWEALEWRVALASGTQLVIVRASKDKIQVLKGPFSGRATFLPATLSLSISPVTQADSGNYSAEFDTESGFIPHQRFCVSVWETVGRPNLEVRVLQQEQGRCNISLLCSVPGAANVSYSWSHDGAPLGHGNVLPVHGDSEPRTYVCNASNPASWSMASIDTKTVCFPSPTVSSILGWAVAVPLVLAVSIVAFVACWCWRKRRKDSSAGDESPQHGGCNRSSLALTLQAPPEHVEPSLTVYEEVGKVQAGQDLNRNREANAVGNTIYAVVSTKAQGPRTFQEPQTCTIYSTIQATKKSPSIRRKKLDPALVCTAYTEPTVPLKHWSPPPRSLSLSPVDHHLS